MSELRRPFAQRPFGIAALAFAHLFLGAVCLYFVMAFGLMEGFVEIAVLGFGMAAVGALSSGVLMHLSQRLRWLWIMSFSILPFVYVVPSYLRFVDIGDPVPLQYWISFPITLIAACYLGTLLADPIVWWYRTGKPFRQERLRRIIPWLS